MHLRYTNMKLADSMMILMHVFYWGSHSCVLCYKTDLQYILLSCPFFLKIKVAISFEYFLGTIHSLKELNSALPYKLIYAAFQ